MGYYNNWNVHVTLIFGLNIPFVKLIRLDNYFFAVRGTKLQSLYMNYSGILFAKCDKYKTKSNHGMYLFKNRNPNQKHPNTIAK